MEATVRLWENGYSEQSLEEIAALWNANASGRHGFFPWSGRILSRSLSRGIGFTGILLEARVEGQLAGFCHGGTVREPGYPVASSVEALLVDRSWRGQGLGTALLQTAVRLLHKSRPLYIDAMGAWPNGYAFSAMADGAERSGVLVRDKALYRLFLREGFVPVRKSYILRINNSDPLAKPRPLPKGAKIRITRRDRGTWLDRVFRARELWNYELVSRDGSRMSRAIFGFMDDLSRNEGRIVFSLFGVNTEPRFRRRGFGRVNLSNLLAHTASLGCEQTELHVYADNAAALGLYRSLGFAPVGETVMMQLGVKTAVEF